MLPRLQAAYITLTAKSFVLSADGKVITKGEDGSVSANTLIAVRMVYDSLSEGMKPHMRTAIQSCFVPLDEAVDILMDDLTDALSSIKSKKDLAKKEEALKEVVKKRKK